jgi:hypothetical protein
MNVPSKEDEDKKNKKRKRRTTEPAVGVGTVKTPEDSDPFMTLLDDWDAVADALTYYQEKIAQEGRIDTPTERPPSHHIPFAIKITSMHTWSDITLPAAKIEQLREVCNFAKNHAKTCVLFTGPFGTGKTMAAEVIANELRLDLFRIDLSTVVSKYIGETEKNLNRVFDATDGCDAVLFFDEADAVFGRRSEAKDSHDRYAKVEIDYLLQRLEQHEGIAVLAVNASKTIDDAFARRMKFIVDFPVPEEEQRRSTWTSRFPEEKSSRPTHRRKGSKKKKPNDH